MAISMSTAVLALNNAGWRLVGGLLLTSAVIMVSVHQDFRRRDWIGAVFGFFMAIVFGITALVTAIRMNLRGDAAICAVVLCCELLLILRWSLRRTSA
jgi:xanthine/uracil/vitamin C permease (AzgA family)